MTNWKKDENLLLRKIIFFEPVRLLLNEKYEELANLLKKTYHEVIKKTYYEVINTFDLIPYDMSVEYFPATFLPSSTSEPPYFFFKKNPTLKTRRTNSEQTYECSFRGLESESERLVPLIRVEKAACIHSSTNAEYNACTRLRMS